MDPNKLWPRTGRLWKEDGSFANEAEALQDMGGGVFAYRDVLYVKTPGGLFVPLRTDEEGRPEVSLYGSNVQPKLRTITTTPLAASGTYNAPTLDLEAPPGIAALAYSVVADTPTQLQFKASDKTSSNVIASIVIQPGTVPTFIPPFKPVGRSFVVSIINKAATAQTVLRVYEHQFTNIPVLHPHDVRALLAWQLTIRDTTLHAYWTDPANAFSLNRIAIGGGKVPIYIDNKLDQALTVAVALGVAGQMGATLGTVSVPAASQKIITNFDFPGLDVPSEEIWCTFTASVAPTSGVINAYIDTLVGGSA